MKKFMDPGPGLEEATGSDTTDAPQAEAEAPQANEQADSSGEEE